MTPAACLGSPRCCRTNLIPNGIAWWISIWLHLQNRSPELARYPHRASLLPADTRYGPAPATAKYFNSWFVSLEHLRPFFGTLVRVFLIAWLCFHEAFLAATPLLVSASSEPTALLDTFWFQMGLMCSSFTTLPTILNNVLLHFFKRAWTAQFSTPYCFQILFYFPCSCSITLCYVAVLSHGTVFHKLRFLTQFQTAQFLFQLTIVVQSIISTCYMYNYTYTHLYNPTKSLTLCKYTYKYWCWFEVKL